MKPVTQAELRPWSLERERDKEDKTVFWFRPIPPAIWRASQKIEDPIDSNIFILRFATGGLDNFGDYKFDDICEQDADYGVKYIPEDFWLQEFSVLDLGEIALGAVTPDKDTVKNLVPPSSST